MEGLATIYSLSKTNLFPIRFWLLTPGPYAAWRPFGKDVHTAHRQYLEEGAAFCLTALTYEVHQGMIGLLRLTPVFSPTINSGAWSFCWQTYSNSS
jgi:hypothetical protein